MDRNEDGLYDNNLDCHWTIVCGPNQLVELRILSIELEMNIFCSFDYIEVSWKSKVGYIRTGSLIRTAARLFHISNIGIKNKLIKQTVKIMMRRLIRSRLIWIYTVCKCMSEFT